MALAAIVSAALLWGISRLFDLDFLRETLSGAALEPLLLATLPALGVMILRGVRFRAVVPVADVPLLVAIMGLKNGVARVTPFRAGELYTLYLLKRHAGVEAPKTLLLIVWLKLVDLAVIVLVFLLGIVGSWGGSGAVAGDRLLIWSAVALVALLALVYAFGFWLKIALAPLRWLASDGERGWRKVAGKVVVKLGAVQAEMSAVGPGRTTVVVLCTVALWSLQLLIVGLILRAFSVEVTLSGLAFGFGATQAALILPLPSVASVGPLEAGWVAGFTTVGVPRDLAAVTGLAANGVLLAYALVIAAGCWVFLRWRRPARPA